MRQSFGSLVSRAVVIGITLLCIPMHHVDAQDEVPDADAATADSVRLVFEREVFTYPMFERRNPFRPQTGDDALGPRFEDLVLLGVIIDPDPTRSIAVVGARPPGATSEQAATRTFRLRRGQAVGNARLIDIQRRQVLMEVDDFGQRETRVLDLIRQPPPLPTPTVEEPAAEDTVGPGSEPESTTDSVPPQGVEQSLAPGIGNALAPGSEGLAGRESA